MTEKFSFFDPVLVNGLPDRDYNAQEFTDYFGDLVTTGVMKGVGAELKVTANGSNMITEIDTGTAFVADKRYANTTKLAHTHDTETLGKNRIDRIVVRMDLNTDARYVKSFIKKGVASATPVAPVLTQTPNVYEISLAQVKVVGGQTYINVADVVDERGKGVICPWAGSNILPNFDDVALAELVNEVENMKPNWIQPPLVGNFVNTDYPLKYMKDHTGLVVITGSIRDTVGSSAVIFNLPVEYRPLEALRFRSIRDNPTVLDTFTVYAHGSVMFSTPIKGQSWIYVSFRIDQ